MTTIATIARETHSQPHEIAALLGLGTDYADDQGLTDEQVALVVAATLNAYAGDNVWQDVIYHVPGLDQEATEQADPNFRGETVILESGYRIEWDHAGWFVAGLVTVELSNSTDHWFYQDEAGETVEVFQDTITVYRDGEEVDRVTVFEPSEDSEPYDAALRAAGYANFTWI